MSWKKAFFQPETGHTPYDSIELEESLLKHLWQHTSDTPGMSSAR